MCGRRKATDISKIEPGVAVRDRLFLLPKSQTRAASSSGLSAAVKLTGGWPKAMAQRAMCQVFSVRTRNGSGLVTLGIRHGTAPR